MKFWKRLKYYGVGLILGTLLSVILFNGRGCSWLPENRVLDRIGQMSTIQVTSDMLCRIGCSQVTMDELVKELKASSLEVVFSESDTDTDPKKYVLEGHIGEVEKVRMEVEFHDTIARIVAFDDGPEPKCNCLDPAREYHVIYMPEEQIKHGFVKREIRFTSSAGCKMKSSGFSSEEYFRLLEEGKIDYEKSKSYGGLWPEWHVNGKSNGKDFTMVVELQNDQTLLTDLICDGCSCSTSDDLAD